MRKILTTLCFAFASQALFAQMMMPVTTTTRTPYGSFKTTNWRPTGLHNYGGGQMSAKYPFTVTMKNDSVFTAKTKINLNEDTHSIVMKDHARAKQTIRPSETKEISRILVDGRKIIGIPADSCWLFKSMPGRINCYSVVAEEGMMYISHIQKGDDGPIVPFTKDNLKEMVMDDPKAMRIAKEGRLKRAINVYNK